MCFIQITITPALKLGVSLGKSKLSIYNLVIFLLLFNVTQSSVSSYMSVEVTCMRVAIPTDSDITASNGTKVF